MQTPKEKHSGSSAARLIESIARSIPELDINISNEYDTHLHRLQTILPRQTMQNKQKHAKVVLRKLHANQTKNDRLPPRQNPTTPLNLLSPTINIKPSNPLIPANAISHALVLKPSPSTLTPPQPPPQPSRTDPSSTPSPPVSASPSPHNTADTETPAASA